MTALRLRFLGTRGEIDLRSELHGRHSVLLVSLGRRHVVVDWGDDWRGSLDAVDPDAVVLTHAHSDHAGGLRSGAQCPVYATDETWRAISAYPITLRERVAPRQPFSIAGLTFEAFPVEHSLLAPAVGYRIAGAGHTVFYAPDLVAIPERSAALAGISVYVGDGASVARPIIRPRGQSRIGHASIRQQLDWCRAESVRRAIFTHCGSQIVRDDEAARNRVVALGRERGVRATIANDGLGVTLRSR